jgi:hypothetical protein
MLADNSKHNQTGRTDEHRDGAFRHRNHELCSVGGVALLLFSQYHVRNCPAPSFVPDFSDPDYGDYGKREWYRFHLFHAGKDPMTAMGYDSMCLAFKANAYSAPPSRSSKACQPHLR